MSKELSASPMEIASLAMLAKEAYDQKRIRESMSLARKILRVDPDNKEALALQAAIRADLDGDLQNARALLDDSRRKEDGEKYRKAAEIALSKILHLDPEHAEAKTLLNGIRGISKPVVLAPPSTPAVPAEIPFTAAYTAVEKKKEASAASRIPFVFAAILIAAIGIFLFRPTHSTITASAASSVPPVVPVSDPQIPPAQPPAAPTDAAAPATQPPVETSDSKAAVNLPIVPPRTPVTTADASKPLTNPTAAPSAPAAAAAPGTLAVSSPTPADIYQDGKYLGSTPTTLELPAGAHTLEYRHNDLRTVATHVVKSNETTTALITFDVTVQINAKPWAQVFIDGTQRQALGQTPLSDVRVPIGKVLVFENPKFPAKTYRVTGKDTTIQVVFP